MEILVREGVCSSAYHNHHTNQHFERVPHNLCIVYKINSIGIFIE